MLDRSSQRGPHRLDDSPEIVRLSDDLERLAIAHEALERRFVGRRDHELAPLQRLGAAHEPEEPPVRVVRRGDVVDDHRRRVMVDEVDEVELALLHVRDVADDGLESFRLQRRAQELDGVLAGVEHRDRGLVPSPDSGGEIALPRASSAHRASTSSVRSPDRLAAGWEPWWELGRDYPAETAMSSRATLTAALSPGAPDHARDDGNQLGRIYRLGDVNMEACPQTPDPVLRAAERGQRHRRRLAALF